MSAEHDKKHMADSPVDPARRIAPEDAAESVPKEKTKKKRKAKTERGVETMFRSAYRTHLDMSNLADTKANIIISINGLIISVLLATVGSSLDANRWLLLPVGILLLSCSSALVFAVLAARPRVSSEVVDLATVREGNRNILFFGTFRNMPEEDFLAGIQDLVHNRRDVYTAMAKDLYSLGGVLEKKYRLIRTAYTIFMFGLVLSVATLVVVLTIEAATPTPPFGS